MAWFIFSLISALALSAENITEKGMIRRQDPHLFAAVHAVLAGVVMLPFIWMVDWSIITPTVFVWVMLGAAISTFAFVASIRAMKHLDVSVASPMFTLTPVVSALLGVILLREALSGGQLFGILLLVLGGYAIQLHRDMSMWEPLHRLRTSKDLQILMLAVFLYPFSAVMARYSFTDLHIAPYHYLVMIKVLGGLYYAAYIGIWRGGLRQIPKTVAQYKGGFFWITFFSTLNSATIYLALAGSQVVQALAVKRLSALFTTVIGGEVFHEKHLVWKTVACVVMIAGALCVAFA
jgi:drug/metabolite transporter (DMT)-like permease